MKSILKTREDIKVLLEYENYKLCLEHNYRFEIFKCYS